MGAAAIRVAQEEDEKQSVDQQDIVDSVVLFLAAIIRAGLVNEGADGLNLMPPLLPDGMEDFVEQVVPALQRRGLFRTAYESATLGGHLGLERPEGFSKMTRVIPCYTPGILMPEVGRWH